MGAWFRRYRPEQVLFLGFLALALALLAVDFFRNPVHGFPGYRWIMMGLLLVTAGLTVWTLLGGLKGPAAIFLAMAFLALAYVAGSLNGVFSVTVNMFILLIVFAVPLLGWGAAAFTTLASLAVVWTLVFLPVPLALPSEAVQARNLTMVFAGVFLLVWWYSRQLRTGAERLRQSNAELEARVEERTRQVLVSEKLATVGRLSAGLAHELNTPLGAVLSAHASAEAALRGGLVAAFRSLIPTEAARRQPLETLVERMLNQPGRLASSAESREQRRQLMAWGVQAGWPQAQTEAFADSLTEIPGLSQEEFLALGSNSEWKTSLALLESVHSLVRSLEVITRGTEKMSLVVKSFQSLSQTDASSVPKVMDPSEEFESVLILLQGRIPQGIDVFRRYDKTYVRCHPDRLGQAMISLILNALHAMGTRGTLRLSSQLEGEHVLLEVSDTGHGVPEALREKIFEPFFTTKSQGEGLGLGLDLARRIVVAEGGSLTLIQESALTRFVIRLPASRA